MKKNFSICTFSLSPRSINGRPFDLQFAPETARAKFSDWVGRRIDNTTSTGRLPRHRWTSDLTARIFHKDMPSLFDEYDNHFIQFDEKSDEGTLRLSLLWNELLEKAESESSPMAVLGLLDIINSQPVFATELYQKLRPYILNSIHNATIKLDNIDAWKFYSALLVKHKKKLMDRQMLNAVQEECCKLAENHREAAIIFLESNSTEDKSSPSVLLAGLGDGLAINYSHGKIAFPMQSIRTRHLLILIATSKKFAKTFIEHLTDAFGDNYAGELKDLFSGMDADLEIKAKKSLVHFVSNSRHRLLLSTLLSNTDVEFYRYTLNILAKNTRFGILEFNNVILEHTQRLRQYDFLKDCLVEYDVKGLSDNLLSQIVFLEPSLLFWLCSSINISLTRKFSILLVILDEVPSKIVDVLRSDSTLAFAVLQILETNLEQAIHTYSNVLVLANAPIEKTVYLVHKLPQNVIMSIDRQLMTDFVIRAFDGISSAYEDVFKEIVTQAEQIDFERILDHITAGRNSRQSVVKNITILLSMGHKVVSSLIHQSEFISNVLVKNLDNNLNKKLEEGWIHLLLSENQNLEIQCRTAAIMLDYSYGCKRYDPSNLLMVAFPIVYKTFKNGKSISRVLPFVFFSDWDKCRTLRYDLVLRYLYSDWSRLGLFKVAIETNIAKEVVAILFDIKGGKKFIERAIIEARLLPSTQYDKVVQNITKLLK